MSMMICYLTEYLPVIKEDIGDAARIELIAAIRAAPSIYDVVGVEPDTPAAKFMRACQFARADAEHVRIMLEEPDDLLCTPASAITDGVRIGEDWDEAAYACRMYMHASEMDA